MIKGDVVEVMIALPGQLFLNTQVPVCLWFLTNNKTTNGRDRKNETLFIDAKNLGTMKKAALKVLTDEDIQKVTNTVSSWKKGEGYKDVEGFCKSATTEEIEKNGFLLTPGRYVGFAEEEEDGISFEVKINKLITKFKDIKNQERQLDSSIEKNLDDLL